MIKKTKFSTITAVMATIAAMAALGSIGGGLGQQQMALAQPVDPGDIGGDETNLGGIGDIIRGIVEDELDDDDNGAAPCSDTHPCICLNSEPLSQFSRVIGGRIITEGCQGLLVPPL